MIDSMLGGTPNWLTLATASHDERCHTPWLGRQRMKTEVDVVPGTFLAAGAR